MKEQTNINSKEKCISVVQKAYNSYCLALCSKFLSP